MRDLAADRFLAHFDGLNLAASESRKLSCVSGQDCSLLSLEVRDLSERKSVQIASVEKSV